MMECDNNRYAPIVVFAFNRLDTLQATIRSLLSNAESSESDLYVYVDGPRQSKVGEAEKVEAVRTYVKSIQGFRSVFYQFSDHNKGLANSVIGGVSDVFRTNDKVIVVEDDLCLSRSFLMFMNKMLNLYAGDDRIMQISGYGCKLSRGVVNGYDYDIYMNERAHSWSWATWKDRWESVDWNVSDYDELSKSKSLQRCFNKRGSDLYGMLKAYMEGENQSWYIRFNYSMYKQGRYSVMPIKSLVRNDGFGNDATNCNAYNRYKVDFEDYHLGEFRVPDELSPNERIMKDSVRYWSIPYRVYGKFMTLINKCL
ncbi:MAG: glycosyl transferase [Paludibacteraceae bacterium]|nr:glycosyl transferase [Paludibacteraceae bacterium]